MKVAFVAFDFGEYCVRLASGIAQKRGASVLLLLPGEEAKSYLHLLNNSVESRFFKKPRLRQPLNQIRMVISLVGQIKKFKPDVIHLQLGHLWFNLLGLPFLRSYPLVLTVHDSLIHVGDANSAKTPQWVFDFACFCAKERIVHAPQVGKLLIQRLDIPGRSVHVVPYVVVGDVALTQEQARDEEPLVLFFGRIWEYKGLEYLIRAEPLITSRVPQAKIVIAGVGEDFDRYRRMMVHPNHFIVHNEYVSDEMRADLFRRSSVVVLPYIEASQSFIISIAYRCSKPVVATTVGGLPAMVDDGKTGFLVPPRDPEALADAIVRLLQDPQLRHAMGANGYRKVNTECDPGTIAEKTIKVYEQAVCTHLHRTQRRDSAIEVNES